MTVLPNTTTIGIQPTLYKQDRSLMEQRENPITLKPNVNVMIDHIDESLVSWKKCQRVALAIFAIFTSVLVVGAICANPITLGIGIAGVIAAGVYLIYTQVRKLDDSKWLEIFKTAERCEGPKALELFKQKLTKQALNVYKTEDSFESVGSHLFKRWAPTASLWMDDDNVNLRLFSSSATALLASIFNSLGNDTSDENINRHRFSIALASQCARMQRCGRLYGSPVFSEFEIIPGFGSV